MQTPQEESICLFIDYEKAFDRIEHVNLIKILADEGLDKNDIDIKLESRGSG